MLNWYPVIAGLPIPQPRTEFVLSKENWWQYLDGKRLPDEDTEVLKAAIARLGGYPVFMRTDLSSGKHNFVDACYVHDEDRLMKNLFGLVEQNALHDLWFDSIAVREFITLDYEFQAFNGLRGVVEAEVQRPGAMNLKPAFTRQKRDTFGQRALANPGLPAKKHAAPASLSRTAIEQNL